MPDDEGAGFQEMMRSAGSSQPGIGTYNAQQLGIDFAKLPQLPFYSKLYAYTQSWYQHEITKSVNQASVFVRRPLTPDERDAIAFHTARQHSIEATWDPPLRVVAGLYFENRGRATLRFPFITPNPQNYHPDVFPSLRMPYLRGFQANIAWSVLRFFVYSEALDFAIRPFLVAYSRTISAVGLTGDQRLSGWRDEFLAKVKKGGPGLPSSTPAPVSHQDASQDTNQDNQDSPSSFGGREESSEQPAKSFNATAWDRRRAQAQAPVAASEEDDDAFLSEDYDDASPLAPSVRHQQQQPQKSSGGSAWDRLRSQAAPSGGKGKAPRETPQASSENNEYVYAPKDDNSVSKAEAQRKFDEMLERERSGKSDSSDRRF
ncbi:hypothetical protein B0H63DRAFT_475949 [Podospora didyma]|uniref:Uncharacterized protein n=1 Tax=Podospora didyma TaxID=330526 RepID=A0AAE0NHG8_9PEZI|nr:hypothetical protein B0H63DRAFT_475949 [Podospora didyma]